MPFSVLFLASLILSYLPVSLSYRDGARSESCYNMLVMHTNFIGETVSPSECSNTCPYELRVVGRVNVESSGLNPESSGLNPESSGLNPNETTYQCGETYHLQLTSTSSSTFEGFMVEARERTVFERSTPTEEDFVIESTIWGTWVTDPNMLYHAVECNRSLTSSEGTFENAATQESPADLTSLDLYWRAPPPPNSSEEYLQLPQQIRFWFVIVQQRLTYYYPIAGPILDCNCSIPGLVCVNGGTFNCRTRTCDCPTGFTGSDCSELECLNNGTFNNSTEICDCPTGFTGSDCSVVDCGPLNNPVNGRVDTPQGTTLNQVANYSCDNQYLLVGNMTRTCQENGMWSGSEPFCQLECLNNGTFNTSTEICDCPTGFTGSNCSVVDCGPLNNPDNGRVDTPQGTTLNQVANYSCDNQYLLVGNMTRTCQENGMWSGSEPFCQLECQNNGTFNTSTEICDCPTGFTGSDCSVVDCGELTNPDNGRVDTPQGTTLYQVANYSCNDGYLLVGNMTRTCQADGMWSGSEPFCQLECLNGGTFNTSTEICDCPTGFTGSNCSVVDCGTLNNPDNGRVDTPQGTSLNQVANYTCNNGYLLVGNMTRTCQADGMWSGSEPFCQLECLNGGTFNPSTEICDCPTGFTGSDCSATAAPTSPPPVTPTQIALNNAVRVTLPQYTAENFTEGPQEAMRNTTATVINRYCAENNEMCRQTVRTRRQVSPIQPSDVIISNIRNNAQGVLEFEMYIQVAGGDRVLAVEVLESAVQSGIDDYMAAGFATVTFVRAVSATTATTTTTATTAATTAAGLSPGVIAAIAAGSVFGVVLVLILLLLCILFCIHKRCKSYREVKLTYTSVLEKPENLYVEQNELATVDSPTEDDTQTDGTEKGDMQKDDPQKDDPQKDDTKKVGTQAENDPEDTAL